MRDNIFLLIPLVALLLFAITSVIPRTETSTWDKVMYVVDGDTFYLENYEYVRLENIDAPEIGTEKGEQAERYVQKLIKDCEQVKVITDGERGYYDRLLAEVETCEGVNVGQALLEKGLAEPYRE